MAKGTKEGQVLVNIINPNLAKGVSQKVTKDDFKDFYEGRGWKIVPAFPPVKDHCDVCLRTGPLTKVGVVEGLEGTVFADLTANSLLCDDCILDLTIPHEGDTY